jgi:hypothetical protein
MTGELISLHLLLVRSSAALRMTVASYRAPFPEMVGTKPGRQITPQQPDREERQGELAVSAAGTGSPFWRKRPSRLAMPLSKCPALHCSIANSASVSWALESPPLA